MVAEVKSLKELVLAHLHTQQTKLFLFEQEKISECLFNNKFYKDLENGYVLSGNKIALWSIKKARENGKKAVTYLQDNDLHRDNDLPAFIKFYEDGGVAIESWKKHGLLHRNNDLPAQRIYYKTGSVRHELWCLNDKMYRRDKPAEIIYYRNGRVKIQRYYWAGKNVSHNGLPAKITYYKNGEVKQIVHKYLPTLPDYEPEERNRELIDQDEESCEEGTASESDDTESGFDSEDNVPPHDWRDNVDYGSYDDMFVQSDDPDSDGAFWGFEPY